MLLFDGVFLLHPELVERWDLSIHVCAAFERTLERARVRDVAAYGSPTEVEQRFHHRYRPSQQLYTDTVRPTERADVVVRDDEPDQPVWRIRPR